MDRWLGRLQRGPEAVGRHPDDQHLGLGDGLAALGLAVSGVLLLVTSLIGRALFYVLVIPTTMPGAFFWKNKGFEQHARDIGLANMPQVGVVPLKH